jgi:predicted PurR-regulated permease PerM
MPSSSTRSALIPLLVAGLVLLAWQLADVLLLGFGGVLVAVLLRSLAKALSRRTPLPVGAALALVVVGLVLAGTLLITLLGPEIAVQFELLWRSLPEAWDRVEQTLGRYGWGRALLERVSGAGGQPRGGVLSAITGTVQTVFGAVADALLVFVVGLFLAADPSLYRRGLARLVTPARRSRAFEVLDVLGKALRRWLLGQFVAMACVGAITAAGLMLIGVPLALALGLLAGLLNFIPYLGPILSAIPAILIAFAQSPGDALNTVLLFVFIQNIEGYVLTPMLQKRAAALPPALTILTVVALGTLFGIYGVLFATPLLLAIMVLVEMLYVEDVLGDRVEVPGRDPPAEPELPRPRAAGSVGAAGVFGGDRARD